MANRQRLGIHEGSDAGGKRLGIKRLAGDRGYDQQRQQASRGIQTFHGGISFTCVG